MAVIDSGDTAWIVMSSALVLLMTPGLALFYGGLVRRKNILSVFMQCLAAICIVGLQWVLFGYSLAFGPDHAGIIGGLSFAGLHGVGLDPNPDYAGTIPHLLFMVYQMMFAVITPGPDHRCLRRAHEVQRLPGLLAAVGHPGLRPAGPLGLGCRRLPA